MKLHVLNFALLFLLFSGIAHGQDSLNVSSIFYEEIGWDDPNEIKIAGDFAFIATKRTGIKIYNISNISDPEFVTTIVGNYNRFALDGDFLFSYDYKNHQTVIYDISLPSEPELISIPETQITASGHVVNNHFVYVRAGSIGLDSIYQYDLNDPYNPIYHEEVIEGYDLDFKDNYMFSIVEEASILYSWDNTDPLEPVVLDSVFLGRRAQDIHIYENTAIIYTKDTMYNPPEDRAHFVDITNPHDMEYISHIGDFRIDNFSVCDNYVIYVDSDRNTQIYDISDPYNVIHTNTWENYNYYSFDGYGTIGAGLYWNGTAFFIDLLSMPEQVILNELDDYIHAQDITYYNGNVYIIGQSYQVYSADIPSEFNLLSQNDNITGRNILIDDSIAYIRKYGPNEFDIVDIIDPLFPSILSTTSGGSPYSYGPYDVQDDNIFLTANYGIDGNIKWYSDDGQGGIDRMLTINDTDEIVDVKAAKDRICNIERRHANEDNSILKIYDIISPEKFELVSWSEEAWGMDKLAVKGKYAYLFYQDIDSRDLLVYDISESGNLSPINSIPFFLTSYVSDAKIYGNYLFVTIDIGEIGGNSITIFDISNPVEPTIVGFYDNEDAIYDITLSDSTIYASLEYAVRGLSFDLPLPSKEFDLVGPANNYEELATIVSNINFAWNESEPIELDESINYRFTLRMSHPVNGDTIHVISDLEDLEIEIDINSLVDVTEISEPIYGIWWVDAISENHTRECSSPFRFRFNPTSDVHDFRDDDSIPTEFVLNNIYPNPFNAMTTISIGLPQASNLKLSVYNINGQEVAVLTNGTCSKGYHQFIFNADNLSSGVYFVHASVSGELNQVKKIVLMR